MKKLLYLIIALVAIGSIAAYMLYNKPHRSTASATSDFVLSAPVLFQEFSQDEALANEKYLDKVIKVKGSVKSVETDEEGNTVLTLDSGDEMFGVICSIPKDSGTERMPSVGESATVKGVCTGMLMDVVLIRCVLEA